MQEMNRDKSSEDIIVDSPIANTDEEPTFAPSGSDEQADYSQEYTPYTVSSMLVPGAALNVPGISLPAAASVDYLFVDEARQRGERGWSEKACYNTGVTYGMGMLIVVLLVILIDASCCRSDGWRCVGFLRGTSSARSQQHETSFECYFERMHATRSTRRQLGWCFEYGLCTHVSNL